MKKLTAVFLVGLLCLQGTVLAEEAAGTVSEYLELADELYGDEYAMTELPGLLRLGDC